MAWSRESRHVRGYGSRWTRLREAVMRRDFYLCQPCSAHGRVTPATEVHHVKPKAEGGTDDLGNLVAICHACHHAATLAQTGRRPGVKFDADGRVVW